MRSKSWNRFLAAFMIVFALLLGACQSTEPEEAPADETAIAEPTGPWPTARLIGELSGHDPIEGFNRSMFEVDCVIMDYIARPLGWIWSSVLPRPVIQCIENACHNLAFPGRLVSSLGSAEFECAGVETGRFLLNSTVGIAGLFDPAEYWFHLYKTDADFGRMFATWGIGPGCRLIIPGSRHINIRDDVGSIFDYLLDIRTYLPYSSWAYVNNVVAMHPQFINVIKGSADPYRTYVMMQLLNRELQLDKWYYDYAKDVYHNRLPELPPDQGTTMPESLHGRRKVLKDYHSLGPVIDTLRAIYFVPQKDHDWWYARLSIFNSDFEDKIHTRKVTVGIDPERSRLRYGFFEAPKPKDENEVRPEKLAIVIPGIGSIYNSQTALATAEEFYNAGYSVVLVDNGFNWRFMTATDGKLPGYTPHDAAKMRTVLQKILADLREDGKIKDPRIVLTGWSMGGIELCHIAAMEEKENTLGISRYLPINPPADLITALQTADSYAAVTKDWTFDEAVEKVSSGAGLQYVLTKEVIPPLDPEKPETFTRPPLVGDDVAKFFVAFSIQSCLTEDLEKTQREGKYPLPISAPCTMFNREDFYREVGDIGFMEYITRFLFPQMGKDISELDKLAAESGLRAVESTLKNNKSVRMIHAWDDILINDADRKFLDETLGDRITWFSNGGHCGQFYTKAFREELLSRAEEE
ncbi:MAG: VacJ family lipoprotein [Lentisphaeria bacterium]|nr:VacJ family lipoprotein [Lentisphaeria bacterium]